MDFTRKRAMIRSIITTIIAFLLYSGGVGHAQNCCVPAVPQQGVLGETTTLPHTLEIGLHYESVVSYGMYNGSRSVDDPVNRRALWRRATLTASYGILRQLSISTIFPFVWKKKSQDDASSGSRFDNTAEGIGDISCFLHFSPLGRSFVNFRELSLGAGVKFPTGAVDRRNFGYPLPEELQPGTGSWDYLASFSFYQGFEPVDIVASVTYVLTTAYERVDFGNHTSCEFGNQLSYLLTSNFHLCNRLDISAALSGAIRERDKNDGQKVSTTGRHQMWLVPGLQIQLIPEILRMQVFYDAPVYQHFNGEQLGSDYNVRVTAVYTLPLKKSEEDDG